MPASSYQLKDLLPHRPPMQLIDKIIKCDLAATTIETEAKIRSEWTDSVSAIELMAQTAAVLAGAADQASGYKGEPRPGFLLGTRNMELAIDKFVPGEICTIQARNIFSDAETASFECTVKRADGTLAAKATLNAYRPGDMGSFLATQN